MSGGVKIVSLPHCKLIAMRQLHLVPLNITQTMNNYQKHALLRSAVLCAASLLSAGGAFAQSVCLSVEQDGAKVSALGTAWHSLDEQTEFTLEFADGKVAVSNGSATVASLAYGDDGSLVLDFGEAPGDNSLSCSVGTMGYATLYSPFQLTIPTGSDVEVYAPAYENGELLLTSATRLAAGTVVAPETGLILKNEGNISFAFTSSTPSGVSSVLSGSSLTIPPPSLSGQAIYTLGHASDDASRFGFCKYADATLAAGKAYLVATNAQAFVPFSFGDEVTAIHNASASYSSLPDGKYLEKNMVVIVKDGHKYDVSGNRITY